MTYLRVLFFSAATLLACLCTARAIANPALTGYPNYKELSERITKLVGERVRVTSIGQTREKREIFLVTLGTGDVDKKPAILIVGDVVPDQVVGSELVLRLIEQLRDKAVTDEAIRTLLAERTIYFIPRPSPDAAEKCFAAPHREPRGNTTPTDDDRDSQVGEDPAEDLNGDGWITMMRVEDVGGEFIPHPDDPRVMIKAELAKQERGKYKLLVEGRDNDRDGAASEDGSGGVNFNRNFPFQFPTFQANAGPHAASELETRAVADFCYDHPNISLVWTMTPEDNLLNPWKPDGNKDRARIRTTLLSDDAKYQDIVAQKYQKLREAKGLPGSPNGQGSFSEWAYFHYGRWSLATRPWWVSPIEEKEKKSEEKRGAEDTNALRYFAEKKIEGFVEWKAFDHPDYPGQKVEIGGFKPFYRSHPPIADVAPQVGKQVEFLLQVEKLAPKLSIPKVRADVLGGGVVRLTATIANEGFLPTHPEMGSVSQQVYPLQITWAVPEKTTWLQGTARSRIGRIAGEGGSSEKIWIVRFAEPLPKELKVSVSAPAVGSASATVAIPAK